MIAFWAMVKLTFRAAFRSPVFLFLFGLLFLAIVLLPNTVTGDGTALSYIQVSLQYSLSAVSIILALSTLWLSCFALAGDLETHQIHMVAVKPVSRITVWLGKCVGVILVHLVLLAAATAMVYGFVLWQFYKRPFGAEEKQRIQQEVMVGRRVTLPEMPQVEQLVDNEFRRRLDAGDTPGMFSESTIRDEIRKKVLSRLGEVKPERPRYWHFTQLRPHQDDPVFLRYRAYVGAISSRDQRETVGQWAARVSFPEDPDRPGSPVRTEFIPFTPYPERIMCGNFREIPLNPAIVNDAHEAIIGFVNLDPQKKSVFFQLADGPKLLVRVTGFEGNYIRAILMIALKLVFLSGLGCAAGGVFSAPVAIFVTAAYLLVGIFSSNIIGLEEPATTSGKLSLEEIHDMIGRTVGEVSLVFVNPIHHFEVSDKLADGELVEWGYIAQVFTRFLIVKGLPLFVIGVWLYRRRELGLVVRR
jgi:hypothetical protein